MKTIHDWALSPMRMFILALEEARCQDPMGRLPRLAAVHPEVYRSLTGGREPPVPGSPLPRLAGVPVVVGDWCREPAMVTAAGDTLHW